MALSINLKSAPRVGRKLRTPQHSWQVRNKPFTLQPVCIAPVLPGETLKNALFQARVVTEPIKNPLVGWWIEYYWFYVKHRDLAGSATFQAMMIDPGTSMASQVVAGAELKMFRHTNKIDWLGQCMDKIVADYFRGEGDAPADVDGLPVVGLNGNSLFDSVMLSSTLATGDFSVDLNANATITASEVERALVQWEFLKANNLMTMSYEDYLRTYGVKVDDPETVARPELLRYIREWSYPTNTVEATTGVPSSAVSWAISERMDKDRFFKEPGFIVGVTCARPKVYFSLQRTAGVNLLDDAYAWLPALMRDDPATSLKRLASNADSIITTTGNAEFVLDIKDLFVYGDQFVNFDIDAGTADGSYVALPSAGLEKRYPTETDINSLFVGGTPTALVKQDGVARFSILGGLDDSTPRGSTTGVVL